MDEFFDGIDRFFKSLSKGLVAAAEYLGSHPWLMTIVILLIVLVLAALVLTILYRKLKGKFLERLIYKREFSVKDAYAGQTIELCETIFNPTFFPLFRVDVEEYFINGLWIDGMRPGVKIETEEPKKNKTKNKKEKEGLILANK